MRVIRWIAGYVLDFFRERVTAEDLGGETIARVLIPSRLKNDILAAVRSAFPKAEFRTYGPRVDLWRVRSLKCDVAIVSMAGGALRERFIGLLSGARHRLLVPSADYWYRFGLPGGVGGWLWGLLDRFILAPAAILWLALLAAWLYATGVVRRSIAAERGETSWRPKQVLAIRLIPSQTFVAFLGRVKRAHPDTRIVALLGSEEGRAEAAATAHRVLSPRTTITARLVRALRGSRFDTVILVGGADYGIQPAYLKAIALSLLPPKAHRFQWELGDPLPGAPLKDAFLRAITARRGEETPGLIARMRLRRAYREEPARGPRIVQIGLTQACNYHCLFCPFHNPTAEKGHRDADLPRMSFEIFARLLGDLKTMGTKMIDICGDGEPFMHPDALDMMALARDMGFDVTLATNAALLSKRRARQLVDIGVRRMHVSFNAATDDVYAKLHPGSPPGMRQRIIDRLSDMAEYAEAEALRPIEVEFSSVLNRLNMHEIPQMVEAARDARAGWFMLILMGPAEGAEELLPRPEDWILIQHDIERAAGRARRWGIQTNLDAIRSSASTAGTRSVYERIPCYIGHEYALVTGDGDVMFCCQCSQPLGNLHEDSFRKIWYSDAYRQARRQARELPQSQEHLPGCECFTACSHVVVNLDVYRKLYGEGALRSVM